MKYPNLRCALLSLALFLANAAARGSEFELYSDLPYLEPERAEKLDVYIPRDAMHPLPVVLYIHGGGFSGGDKAWGVEKPTCEAIAKAGYAVVSINYKLNVPRGYDAFPQNIEDCKSALRWIRKEAGTYGFDPTRIATAGGSAGGHLALLVAYTPNVEELNRGALYGEYPAHVSCVLDFYGITDVHSLGHRSFVGPNADAKERARVLDLVSPLSHVSSKTVPTLVIHGTADHVVPFAQAELLVERLRECGVPHDFLPIPKGEHAFAAKPHPRNQNTDLMPTVTKFLQEHLR